MTDQPLTRDGADASELTEWLSQHQATLTTDALARMEDQVDWFGALTAQERSWITVVIQEGIDGFRRWLDRAPAAVVLNPFAVAPQALTRRISLRQTVELMRVTIGVIEDAVADLPEPASRERLTRNVLRYSRDLAFTAAEVYARAAESRGNWDARIEALVVDAVVRAEADDTLLSRASTLGWAPGPTEEDQWVCVVIGAGDLDHDGIEMIRQQAENQGLALLGAQHGGHVVVVLGGAALSTTAKAVDAARSLESYFGQGPIVVGSPTRGLESAHTSAKEANAGIRAVAGWPDGPKTLAAAELLPERVLSGDDQARRELIDLFDALAEAGGELLETCATFFEQSGSVEATARALFVHPNTVRYRLKRIQETTDYSPTDARDAYALRMALSVGRLAPQAREF